MCLKRSPLLTNQVLRVGKSHCVYTASGVQSGNGVAYCVLNSLPDCVSHRQGEEVIPEGINLTIHKQHPEVTLDSLSLKSNRVSVSYLVVEVASTLHSYYTAEVR